MPSTKLMRRQILEAVGGATAGYSLYGLLRYEAQYIEICNYPSPSHHLVELCSSGFAFAVNVLQHGSTWAFVGAIGVLSSCYIYRLWKAANE
ncbi:MAG: hypothetical protein P4L53_26655 [Candidatus Obscuribacterales bacterium]|nr:hypothetical protein [Candidatus Obscuribacterales bacterium]